MYILKCFLDGELHRELTIEPGKELIIGRDASCDIQLEAFPGISREHLKIIHLGEKILIERLSQAGKLIVDGQSERSIETVDHLIFSIPPYNFEVQAERVDAPVDSSSKDDGNNEDYFPQNRAQNEDEDAPVGNFEATSLSRQDLIGYIKKIVHDRIVEETPLEGHKWKFGRAPTNEFFVDYTKASRQHFEIFKLNDNFYIKDLGSSNGTYLNGHQLPANNEIELKTGDMISINEYKIIFEIRNRSHEQRMSNLPQVHSGYNASSLGKVNTDDSPSAGFAVEKIKGGSPLNVATWDKNKKMRAAILAVLAIGAMVMFMMPEPQKENTLSKEQIAAETRRREEEKFIENAKIAALQYMDQANWSHCIAEVQRIQEIRPEDSDASEIALRCQTAMERLERQNQLERQERDRQELLERVANIINGCRDKVEEGAASVELCLQPAIELSPENEQIAILLDMAQRVDIEREAEEAKKAEYQKRLSAGRSLLKTADRYKDKENWDEAVKWYKKYLAVKYPDPQKLDRPRAEREIASIQSALASTLSRALDEALAFYNQENYREAILAARKGLAIDSYHKDLKKVEQDSLNILRAEIRSMYQDSIIMEDLGKIHTAISKWKQIIEKDVPGEDYFNKASSKLKIYETEI